MKNEDLDVHLFHEGTFHKSYKFLGAHPIEDDTAIRFVVWAPRAKSVNLMGDFNDWDDNNLPLKRIENTGLWSICVKDVKEFDNYKYRILSAKDEVRIKADPYAFYAEERPLTASKYYDIRGFEWKDDKWMDKRKNEDSQENPMIIYEVNLCSWKKKEDGSLYSYRELADELVKYAKYMGFTHIELMPITEHPYDGSWGYQNTGYFAPTSRFGTPKDFMYFVDRCHRADLGVIIDWVPVHFTKDDHGLARFDGTYCYESSDYIKAENEAWGTLNFDFHKPEVFSFLISSALYWMDYYHIDGIRVDAVAYMIYHDSYGKDIKNIYGGRENLQAIDFIKKLNSAAKKYFPHVLMIAEESTTWPKLTYPVEVGGLGFDYKWNMGWMNDILEYMETDPLFRKGNQKALTFSIDYAFSENFLLPLSHDEVVHGKKSLIDKMPGEYNEKFSNLRLLYLYMFTHPGKKLLFMGGEFAQFVEWNEWKELDWFLLEYDKHIELQKFIKELNKLYTREEALYSIDNKPQGFNWIEHTNHQESIIAFERISKKGEKIIGIFNFTPVKRKDYSIGVDQEGIYKTIMTSDHTRYGGNTKRVKSYKTYAEPKHERDYSIRVYLPALGGLLLKIKGGLNDG
ncbi:1,4-alpha-glucan branching protein GlgB [Clostridium sp. D2Q-11]|uniref:1,4-alpha-glucan branching enzyme GlgB n=1 Tax=Anaeromonas frigoriresistens TaxID=2683708 RepID=A0A942USF5_9FIRM|nr:1,4-alpha-glucan branching protein GlgB [Anaeromonas frigoriresistens]